MKIVGYSEPLTVRPGEEIRFMVSCREERYRADVVRLVHGDENPSGPGLIEEEMAADIARTYAGREQRIAVGSVVEVPDDDLLRPPALTVLCHVFPTTPRQGRQGLVTKWSDSNQAGYGLYLDDRGRFEFVVRTGTAPVRVTSTTIAHAHRWYLAAGSYDSQSGLAALTIAYLGAGGHPGRVVEHRESEGEPGAPVLHSEGPLLMAGHWTGSGQVPAGCSAFFNGKIGAPRLHRDSSDTESVVLRAGTPDPRDPSLVAAWDLAADIPSSRVRDVGAGGLHGRTHNMPTRGVTGHLWRGDIDHPDRAPDQYDAIHFHDDDLDDAGWTADASWRVPVDLASGIYALRLSIAEDPHATDRVPFFVLPPRSGPHAPIAFLVPTNSYYAYANERLEDSLGPDLVPAYTGDQERYEYIAANRLLSIYDFHSDGSGVCHSSRLRPNLTMRPNHRMRLNNIPHLFAGDLHITHWLEAEGHRFDVLTDEALHFEGRELLQPYRVVVTGTHPEYWSRQMLDALEQYLESGGRCMYLGGNGFYWVTAFDPERPHMIEVRRPPGTTRAWEAWPGESHLASTGEPGGLWRHRGWAPQRLLGVGFTAQGFDRAAPYYVNPELDERMAFVFAGVDLSTGAVCGGPSLVLDTGAAGFELDRVDHELGTPPDTFVLASSRHSDYSDSYQHVVEEVLMSNSLQGGPVNPLVRADMVIVPHPNGGAVFSTGSIAWSGGLSAEGPDGDVARITRNVLTAFLRDDWIAGF